MPMPYYYYYEIRNQHGTKLWSGQAISAKLAWDAMWNECKYPRNEERSITKMLEQGFEIHCNLM